MGNPQGVYIVIDTAENLLYLKEGTRTRLKALVSSGSGSILKDPGGQRQWVFDSPRGEFEVKRKMTGPVWIKPDWAFIEEGKKIPRDRKERIEVPEDFKDQKMTPLPDAQAAKLKGPHFTLAELAKEVGWNEGA